MRTMLSTSTALSIVAATCAVVLSAEPATAATNLALNKPATGSAPCASDEGPAKAFNGSVSGGNQTAFNTGFNRAQFDQARRDFPGITY